MMTYLPYTNCGQEILDPTNPSEREEFVHALTLAIPCSIKDLPRYCVRDTYFGVVYVAYPEDYSEMDDDSIRL